MSVVMGGVREEGYHYDGKNSRRAPIIVGWIVTDDGTSVELRCLDALPDGWVEYLMEDM